MGKKYEVDVDVDVKGQKELDKLNASLDQTEDKQEDIAEGSDMMGSSFNRMTGGAVAGFAALRKGVKGTIVQMGVLKAAVMATGLGALLIAIVSITQAFKSSEEGQNKWRKIMNGIGVVVGKITDALAFLGDLIIGVFENPQKAIQDFKEMIRRNIEVRIEAATAMFGYLGSAIKKVFSGDFSGAMDDAISAGKKFIDMNTGIEDTFDRAAAAAKDFVEEVVEAVDVMTELTNIQNMNDKLMREQLVRRAKLEGEVAERQLKALDQENYNVQERIGFLTEALALQEEIYAAEEEIARNKLEVIRETNKLTNSTKEDKMAEAEAEANLIRLQKQRADAARRIFSMQQSLIRQEQAARDAAVAAELKRIDDVNNAREKSLEKEQEYYDKQMDMMIEEMEKQEQERLDAEQARQDAQIAANERMFATMEAVGQGWLAMLGSSLMEFSDHIKAGTGKSVEAIGAVVSGSLQAVGQLMNMIADQIDVSTREGFEKQKKIRIAAAVMDTFAAMIAGLLAGLSAGGPWGIALGIATAAMAGAFGAVQVGKISKTQFEGAGTGGSTSGPSAPRASAVGGSSGGSLGGPTLSLISPNTAGENRLANALGQEQEPTKAYVTSTDMTSQQAMDRHIESNASI